MAWQVLIAIATLFTALLLAGAALAHNVTEGDAGYVQEVTCFRPIAFIYLGAKHMVMGYDHLIFLACVISFLYRAKDIATGTPRPGSPSELQYSARKLRSCS